MRNQKHQNCYNCGTKLVGKYCSNCSQKSDTKRLDFKHFMQHDIIHGAFHFDKGLLYTLKEIMLRPGKVTNDYISGKRVRYYNFFYLSLLIIGFTLLLQSLHQENITLTGKSATYIETRNFASKNIKYILLSFIPFFALSSRIVYRKVHFNIAEHTIIASVTLIYFLVLNLLSEVLDLTRIQISNNAIFSTLSGLLIVYIYYQTFKQHYTTKKWVNALNAFLTLVLFSFLFFLLMFMIIYILTTK